LKTLPAPDKPTRLRPWLRVQSLASPRRGLAKVSETTQRMCPRNSTRLHYRQTELDNLPRGEVRLPRQPGRPQHSPYSVLANVLRKRFPGPGMRIRWPTGVGISRNTVARWEILRMSFAARPPSVARQNAGSFRNNSRGDPRKANPYILELFCTTFEYRKSAATRPTLPTPLVDTPERGRTHRQFPHPPILPLRNVDRNTFVPLAPGSGTVCGHKP
jgi:hypothetical protein